MKSYNKKTLIVSSIAIGLAIITTLINVYLL